MREFKAGFGINLQEFRSRDLETCTPAELLDMQDEQAGLFQEPYAVALVNDFFAQLIETDMVPRRP